MEHPIFFKDWSELGRAALIAVIGYAGFIILLRSSGKRTLARMNVFDFVFVVALGSTLADTMLTPDITVAKGLVACATLVILQITLSWLTTTSAGLEKLINGEPTLLFYRGKFLDDVMKRERVTKEEIRTAIRLHELASAEEIEAVILETDGTFAVVWRKLDGSQSTLIDIVGQEREGKKSTPKSKASSEGKS
jgi:uncharacterized membrane protein YcaP (DUF421 family)